MSWSRPEMQERVGRILREWQSVLEPAFRAGLATSSGSTRSGTRSKRVVSLVLTFNEGVILERLSIAGVDSGARAIADRLIDRMLRAYAARTGEGIDTMRARYPDEEGFVERDGVRSFYEVLGERRRRRCCCCRRGRSLTLASGRRRFPTSRATSASLTFDAPATAAPTGPLDPAAYAEQELADDALAVMDATGTDRAVFVSLSARRRAVPAAGRATTRSGSRAPSSSAPGVPLPHPAAVARGAQRFDERPSEHAGLAEVQPPLLARPLRGALSSSSSRSASASPTRPSSARTRSAGRSRPTPGR